MQIEPSKQLQSRQKVIHRLEQQNQQLKTSNNQLKQQVQKISQQRNKLRDILHKDPLFHIFQGQANLPIMDSIHAFSDYQQQQRRLGIYHEKLQISQNKINILTNKINEEQRKLKQTTRELIKSQERQMNLQSDSYFLDEQMSVLRSSILSHTKTITAYSERHQQLNDQVYRLKEQMIKKQNQNKAQLIVYANRIKIIAKIWTDNAQLIVKPSQANEQMSQGNNQFQLGLSRERVRELSQKFKQQQEIMEEMGKQLDERNQQIAKLLSLGLQNRPTQAMQFDQHTVSSMLHLSRRNQKMYRDLLQKYKEVLQSFDKSYKQKLQLQKQYQLLKQHIQSTKGLRQESASLKKQNQNYKLSYEKLKRDIQVSDDNTIAVLEQNQALHHMMFDKYGHKFYQDKIEEQVKKYEQRKAEREGKQKWASINELVNMNRKLKEKLTHKR